MNYINAVTPLIAVPSEDNAKKILENLKLAKLECNNGKDKGKCENITIPSELKVVVTKGYHQDATEDQTYGQQTGGKRFQESKAYETFLTDMNTLETACQKVEDEAGHSKAGLNAAVAGGAAVVAGLSGFLITKGVQEVKYENAANEAVKAWMEEVGDHITCYVGTEEVGTYGDPIALEIN